MDCKTYQDKILSDYLDNAMNEKEREELNRHVAGCSTCRELLDSAQQVNGDQKKEEMLKPPAYVWEGIKNTLREPAPRFIVPFWVRGLAAAGIIACILTVTHISRAAKQDRIVGSFLEEQMAFLGELDTDYTSENLEEWDEEIFF